MTTRVTGPEALRRIDKSIADARKAVADAIDAAEEAEARQAAIAQERVTSLSALAVLRLDIVAEEGPETETEREIAGLLQRHADYTTGLKVKLSEASHAIAALEGERERAAVDLGEAVQALEVRAAEVLETLQQDDTYRQLRAAAEEADAVAERAEKKLELARADRAAKGAPYESDALFSYLWARRFRTPEYEGSGLIRSLDNWVAKLCGYDAARLNYARLTELPDRLGEHLDLVREEREAALDTLEAAEAEALKDAGGGELRQAIEEAERTVERLDDEMEAREAEHLAIVEAHERALSEESGPAADARRLLAETLETASIPDLRVLASETVTLEDDRLVDALVRLRAEELDLEIASKRIEAAPSRRRRDLERLERFRSDFKRQGLDQSLVEYATSDIDQIFFGLIRGEQDARGALRAASRAARRRRRSRHGGPRRGGGAGRAASEIAGTIAYEILRQSMRGGWSGGRRSSGRSMRWPRSGGGGGRSGGGFRTGGGF